MRGRKPERVRVRGEDRRRLERIARSRHLPWFVVERARVILARAAGVRPQVLAWQTGCDRSTIWRLCRRYAHGGVEALLAEAPRDGRPWRISPPAESPDPPTGLLGTRGA